MLLRYPQKMNKVLWAQALTINRYYLSDTSLLFLVLQVSCSINLFSCINIYFCSLNLLNSNQLFIETSLGYLSSGWASILNSVLARVTVFIPRTAERSICRTMVDEVLGLPQALQFCLGLGHVLYWCAHQIMTCWPFTKIWWGVAKSIAVFWKDGSVCECLK